MNEARERTGALSSITAHTWVALENPLDPGPHLKREFGKKKPGPVAVEEVVKAIDEIRPISDPADGTIAQPPFKPDTLLLVAEILELPGKKGRNLTWARVEVVE